MASAAPEIVYAHDLPPLVADADVDARFSSAMEKLARPVPTNADMLEAIEFVTRYEIQSMKAGARCGGKFLASRIRRVICLQALSDKLIAGDTGE